MDVEQKFYAVVLAIEEAALIRATDKPIFVHYEARYLKNISGHELAQIIVKLADDEKLIKILRIPPWVNEAVPFYLGPLEIEESFKVELLTGFKEYAEDLHKKFEGYIYNDQLGYFEKYDPKSPLEKIPKLDRDTLSTKEKNTLLKLILGMAVKGYSYDPKKLRNSSIADIANDLDSMGISVDQDTIRKWLKEAAEGHYISQTESDD